MAWLQQYWDFLLRISRELLLGQCVLQLRVLLFRFSQDGTVGSASYCGKFIRRSSAWKRESE